MSKKSIPSSSRSSETRGPPRNRAKKNDSKFKIAVASVSVIAVAIILGYSYGAPSDSPLFSFSHIQSVLQGLLGQQNQTHTVTEQNKSTTEHPSHQPILSLDKKYELKEEHDTPFGRIAVIDKIGEHRFLVHDGSILGGHHFDEIQSSAFTAFPIQAAVLHTYPVKGKLVAKTKKMLVIGLGTGLVARRAIEAGARVDVVEINPVVAEMAAKYFGFKSNGPLSIQDAEDFLFQMPNIPAFDYVVHDIFTGGSTASNLLTVEVFERIKQVMRIPTGILVVNFYGFFSGENSVASKVVYNTLRGDPEHPNSGYKYVKAYRDNPRDQNIGNIIFFASNSPIEFHLPKEPMPHEEQPFSENWILRNFHSWEIQLDDPNDKFATNEVLRDYNHKKMVKWQEPIGPAFWSEVKDLLPKEMWGKAYH